MSHTSLGAPDSLANRKLNDIRTDSVCDRGSIRFVSHRIRRHSQFHRIRASLNRLQSPNHCTIHRKHSFLFTGLSSMIRAHCTRRTELNTIFRESIDWIHPNSCEMRRRQRDIAHRLRNTHTHTRIQYSHAGVRGTCIAAHRTHRASLLYCKRDRFKWIKYNGKRWSQGKGARRQRQPRRQSTCIRFSLFSPLMFILFIVRNIHLRCVSLRFAHLRHFSHMLSLVTLYSSVFYIVIWTILIAPPAQPPCPPTVDRMCVHFQGAL